MVHSLLLRWGCRGASEGELCDVFPRGSLWHDDNETLRPPDSSRQLPDWRGDGVEHDLGDLARPGGGDEWL
jgi:hypothetical protein